MGPEIPETRPHQDKGVIPPNHGEGQGRESFRGPPARRRMAGFAAARVKRGEQRGNMSANPLPPPKPRCYTTATPGRMTETRATAASGGSRIPGPTNPPGQPMGDGN
jgi:hypothetical protein